MKKIPSDLSLPIEEILQCILIIRGERGEKVVFDAHLAILYGVSTKVLLQTIIRYFEILKY